MRLLFWLGRLFLRFTDWEAELLRRWFPPKNQMRLGVWMTNLGVALSLLVFSVSEPPLIFEMSALALVFGGVGTVVTARLAEKSDSAA